MTIRQKTLAASVLLLCIACEQASAQGLRLVPEPKQAQKREGRFTITPKTRIVINAAHAEEDRTAAETLIEEIEAATRFATTIWRASFNRKFKAFKRRSNNIPSNKFFPLLSRWGSSSGNCSPVRERPSRFEK